MRKKSEIEKIIEKIKSTSTPEFEIMATKGKTKIVGDTPSLATGLSIIVNCLKESGLDERLIKYAVKIGLNPEKEMAKTMEQLKHINLFDLDID